MSIELQKNVPSQSPALFSFPKIPSHSTADVSHQLSNPQISSSELISFGERNVTRLDSKGSNKRSSLLKAIFEQENRLSEEKSEDEKDSA